MVLYNEGFKKGEDGKGGGRCMVVGGAIGYLG
jgi:hypothetical protein